MLELEVTGDPIVEIVTLRMTQIIIDDDDGKYLISKSKYFYKCACTRSLNGYIVKILLIQFLCIYIVVAIVCITVRVSVTVSL